MDALSLDRLLEELRPALEGRHLGRPKPLGRDSVSLEVSGGRDLRLVASASRAGPGLYLLGRDELAGWARLPLPPASGRTRHALLLLKKHLGGARVSCLARLAGDRALLLACGDAVLALRVGGRAPALTLAAAGEPVASLGEGPAAWPAGEPRPERELAALDAARLAAIRENAQAAGRAEARALLAGFPTLGAELARRLAEKSLSLAALGEALRDPRPCLHLPPGGADCHDSALVSRSSVVLAPLELPGWAGPVLVAGSWREAGALYGRLLRRGEAFALVRAAGLAEVHRELARLGKLEASLGRDLERLDDPDLLRRQGETLLAGAASVAPGAGEAQLPDPYEPSRSLRLALDPGLSAVANAGRLFDKARRAERGRRQIALRLAQVRRDSPLALAREGRLAAAQRLSDLPGQAEATGMGPPVPRGPASGPRSYLTSRGLSLLVGRSARENHQITFALAAPEDVWLHARDVPGAHVVLRDNEGRAGAADLREAAEVAAFFSEASSQAAADVHVTRRKHVRPVRGAPGRVQVAYSETLRVRPRDPEGRLRRRASPRAGKRR